MCPRGRDGCGPTQCGGRKPRASAGRAQVGCSYPPFARVAARGSTTLCIALLLTLCTRAPPQLYGGDADRVGARFRARSLPLVDMCALTSPARERKHRREAARVPGENFCVTRTLATLRTPAPVHARHACQLSSHLVPSCVLRMPPSTLTPSGSSAMTSIFSMFCVSYMPWRCWMGVRVEYVWF